MVDLREAALLGFGRYDWFQLGGVVAAGLTTEVTQAPAAGGRPFILLGDLMLVNASAIPDMIQYQVTTLQASGVPVAAAPWKVMEDARTPLLVLLTPETPRCLITLALTGWLSAYMASGANIQAYVEILTGQMSNLQKLRDWIAHGTAPVSIIESAVSSLEQMLSGGVEGSYY